MQKRILSLALALILTLALAPSTFAAETKTITTYGQGVSISGVSSVSSEYPETWHKELEGFDEEGFDEYDNHIYFSDEVTYYCDETPVTVSINNSVYGLSWYWGDDAEAPTDNTQMDEMDGYEIVVGNVVLTTPGTYMLYFNNGTSEMPAFYVVVGASASSPTSTPSDISVALNGSAIQFDQPPVIEDGRTLVPLRAIFEAMSADIDWNGDTQTVTAIKDDIKISLQIGSNILIKNGKEITLDVPAKIVGGRTLVPARAVAESFGAKVDWDAETQTVIITN